jgi:hypothetical protein
MPPRLRPTAGRKSTPASRANSVAESEYLDPKEETQPYASGGRIGGLGKLIPRPDKYSGKSGNDVMLFIYAITNYFSLLATAEHITDVPEHIKIMLTGTFLTGYALLWYRAHATRYSTFKALCTGLRKQFGDINLETTCRTKLENLEQVGSVTDYAAAFTELGLLLSTEADDYFLTDEAHYAFIRGLSPDIRTAVALAQKGSKDCQEAMTLAAEYESAKRMGTAKPNVQPNFNNNRPNFNMQRRYPNHGRVNNITTNRHAPPPPPPRRDQQEIKCYNCGELGHIARNCHNPPKNWRRAANN